MMVSSQAVACGAIQRSALPHLYWGMTHISAFNNPGRACVRLVTSSWQLTDVRLWLGVDVMQCQTMLTLGRVRLSSLSASEPARDHAYLDIRQASSPAAQMTAIRKHARQLARQCDTVRQLQATELPARQRQLLGFFHTPASTDAADGRLALTARLDATWHLAALQEAREAARVPVGLPPLVPAAVQCFSGSSSKAGQLHNGQTSHNFAAAAVSPAASGRTGSLTADIKLVASDGGLASGQVSGLVVRPIGSVGAVAEQSLAQGARPGVTYCTEWQAAAPESECLANAKRESTERARTSAVSLVLADCPALRASAAALATLQSLTVLTAPPRAHAAIELVSTGRTSSAYQPLRALLGSAALEHSSELTTSSHSADILQSASSTVGIDCLHVSMAVATAPSRAFEGRQDGRCAANVRQVPRLLPAVARLAPDCVVDTDGEATTSGQVLGGCHLVTGGLGALGLAAAGWLLASGASQVHLSSRNIASTQHGTLAALSTLLRHAPATAVIVISQADVAAPDDLDPAQLGLDAPWRGAALDPPALSHP